MTLSTATAVSLENQDSSDENPHYLQAVTRLGEQQEIVAHSDIYAANGMKLLAKGAVINRDQFLRLIEHKLKVSIDCSISLESAVDSDYMAREAGKLLDSDALIRQMASRTGDPLAIKHTLAQLELPFPLAIRLAVMRGDRPKLFHHTLRTTMIAFFLGQRMRLSANEISLLLLAAICHDFGELHTDPFILMPEHVVTPEERRFIHVHPITGHILLAASSGIAPMVLKVVMQHHERLDGSGYPYGLMAEKITPLAKVLAVADVAEAVLDRFDAQRLNMLLRVGRVRFDPEVLNILRDLIDLPHSDAIASASLDDFPEKLERLAQFFQSWQAASAILPVPAQGDPDRSAKGFMFARMRVISNLVVQAGFDPNNVLDISAIDAANPEIGVELRNMLDEIDWLLSDLANEFDRRSPGLDSVTNVVMSDLLSQYRMQ